MTFLEQLFDNLKAYYMEQEAKAHALLEKHEERMKRILLFGTKKGKKAYFYSDFFVDYIFISEEKKTLYFNCMKKFARKHKLEYYDEKAIYIRKDDTSY